MTVAATTAVAVLLVAVSVAVLQWVSGTMRGDAESIAEVQARNLAIVAEVGRLEPLLDVDAAGATIVQVARADGEVIARSRQLVNFPPLGTAVPLPGQTIASTVRLYLPGAENPVDFRVVAVGTDSPHGPVAVYAGVSLTESQQITATLARVLFWGLGLVLLAVAVISWLLVRGALRPVDAIRSEVDQLTDGDLARRVPVPVHRDEIHRLAITMNRMLARLQVASDQQRAFISDASHELRSPLASLRVQLEVAAAHPSSTTVPDVVEDALADVQRLQNLAEDLLALAQLDAGAHVDAELLDPLAVVQEVIDGRHGDRVPVHVRGSQGMTVFVAQHALHRIVTNIVDNAVRYARTEVVVDIAPHGADTASISITDDGPGIAVSDQERIFERFVRVDGPRSREVGGTGLGLPIARQLARAYGGDVNIESSATGTIMIVTVRTR